MRADARTFTRAQVAEELEHLVIRQAGGRAVTHDMRLGRDLGMGLIERGLLQDEIHALFGVKLVPFPASRTIREIQHMVAVDLGPRLQEVGHL